MKAFIILSSCVMLAIARPEAGYSYSQPAQQYNVQPASASVSIGSFNGGSSSSYSQQQSAPVQQTYSSGSSSSYSQPANSVSVSQQAVQYQSAPAPIVQQYQPQIISAPAPAPVQYQQQAAPAPVQQQQQQQQQQQTSYNSGSSYGNAGSSYNVGASYTAAESSLGSGNYQQQQQQQQQSSYGGISGPSNDEVFSASFNSGAATSFGNGGASFGSGAGNFGSSGSNSFGSGSTGFGGSSGGFSGSSGEGTTIVQKHIYVHVPPPEQEQVRQQSVQSGSAPAQKHYKIIFIKAPTQQTFSPAAVAAAQANSQEKTIVYVLVKKPEEPIFEASAPNVPIIQPTKPEVYFIKYKAAARDSGASGSFGGVSGGSGVSGISGGSSVSGSSIDSISISNPLLDERSNGGGILSGESSSSHGSVVSKPAALYGAVH